ncbi:hypothetical protein QAD02_003243 [Eretmocerus hayati]|uniref:Uncharacterized protein n=1 Tax=Eretmocerus hayati TaxID=131215 RepID=A0ACC2NLM7_9HYME|nr:hypothetical protein QAD02_003243 [Eretmocerus hayati]
MCVDLFHLVDWTKCKKAMTNFENYGIYSPTREQRSQLKRKRDEDYVTQNDEDYESEYNEEAANAIQKRCRVMQPSDKVNLTAGDVELANKILEDVDDWDAEENEQNKENEQPGITPTLSTSRPTTPLFQFHSSDEIDDDENSRGNTPSRSGTPSLHHHGRTPTPDPLAVSHPRQTGTRSAGTGTYSPPAAVAQEPQESKRMKIARLEEENEKLRARVEKRDRKIVKLNRIKVELEAKLQNGTLRVSPTANRNTQRMIGMPPKECFHKRRQQSYPLPTKNYQLPEYVVAHAKTYKTVKEFSKFIIPIAFTREERRNHSLYGATVASNKFDPRPALPVERLNAVLNLLWELFSHIEGFEGEFGDEYRKIQPKRRTTLAGTGRTA